MAWNGTANFFVIMVETLGPVFLVRAIHLRPAYVGVLLALGAAGGVAGGLASKPLTRRIGSARLSWLSMTVFTLPGLLIPMARPGWGAALFAVGWMSWTFGSTLCAIALTSYQQATCPARLRGRVSAASRWVNWGTLPLGGAAPAGHSARSSAFTSRSGSPSSGVAHRACGSTCHPCDASATSRPAPCSRLTANHPGTTQGQYALGA